MGLVTMVGVLALGQAACGSPYEPGGQGPPTEVVPVEGVKVTPQSVVMIVIGETRQLTAAVGPDKATDMAVDWESTDTTVATVDTNGLVTARGIGSGVFITAVTHDGHLQSSANVSVDP